MKTTQAEQQKLIPLSKWNDYYDYPKVGSLRQYAFHNTNNFRNEVVRCIGKKRLYIDVEAFFKWIENTQTVGG